MTAPWEEKDDTQLTKLIRKAKRKTFIRNTAISLGVTLIVLGGGMYANAQFTSWMDRKGTQTEYAVKQISGPNLYNSMTESDHGFLSAKLELHRYKVVEGVAIPWETRKVDYDLSNRFAGIRGSHGYISVPDPQMAKENYEYYRNFNSENGQREMSFYVPGVNYNGKVLNDLPALAQMDPGKLVEMAISFDQSYTQSEVEHMLPSSLTQAWYWVDTYDNKKQLEFITNDKSVGKYGIPEIAGNVYGYGPNWEGTFKATPENFIDNLQQLQRKGSYFYEYRRIFDYLRKDKNAPDASDVQLLGVVLTGTAKELQALNGKAYVNAAVLGAVVHKY